MGDSICRMIRPIDITPAMLTSSTIAEADATEWTSAGAPYAADVIRMVTTTANGASEATHHIYRSTAAANSADPTLRTTYVVDDEDVYWWADLGPTNRWAMLDQSYQTQSEAADEFTFVLTPGALHTGLMLGNVEALEVRVQQSVSGYDETFTMTTHTPDDWWEFFYEAPLWRRDLAITDLPPYPESAITVTVTNEDSTAKLGVCVLGTVKALGETQNDAERDINDYSQTIEDEETGAIQLDRRGYSKRFRFELYIDREDTPDLTRTLEDYRATPVAIVGDIDYDNTILYGFFGPWRVPISTTGRKVQIEFRSMT